MDRKYNESLAQYIRDNTYIEKFNELDVEVKPLPDGEAEGAVDKRVYKMFRPMALMQKVLPKKMFEMNFDEKGIVKLRKMFNKVDSHPMVLADVVIDEESIEVEDGSITLKVYRKNKDISNLPVLYYIHGGGFFAGRAEVVEEAMKLLVVKYDVVVFSVNYRLAPEYPFPIGHNDTYAGYKWVLDNAEKFGGDNNNVFIAGDSAGGNLTQFVTNQSVDEGLDNIKGQVLLYPAVNLTGERDHYYDIEFDKFPIYNKHKGVIDLAMGMLGESTDGLSNILKVEDSADDRLSPYFNIREKNPPTLLSVGEFDALREDTFAFARKLKANDIDTKLVYYRGMPHAYIDQVGNYPQAEICVEDIGEFINEYTQK